MADPETFDRFTVEATGRATEPHSWTLTADTLAQLSAAVSTSINGGFRHIVIIDRVASPIIGGSS